jgi:carboxyl-terminal processing protease
MALRRELSAYEEVRQKILDSYVGEVSNRELLFGALEGMAGNLDAHSEFWTPKRRDEEKSTTTGLFGGLGIEIAKDPRKGLIVLRPLPNSPASKAGLLPEDCLVEIDGVASSDVSIDRARELIRGQPGSIVKLKIRREGNEDLLSLNVERAEIKIDSVQEVTMLASPEASGARIPDGTPKIGYVLVAKFQEDTSRDLDRALTKLEADGLQGMILDLRGNHGGLLDEAVSMCDLLLSTKGLLILTVRGRDPDTHHPREEKYESSGISTHPEWPMALLVDSGSASASEIVAGCLKDRKRAVLVGEKTYGKGSVQSILPIPLQDWGEAALKLTTGKFYSPSDSVIDGKGVLPDHIIPLNPAQQIGLQRERYRRQVLRDAGNGGGIPPGFFTQPKTEGGKPVEPFHDTQLEKAVEVVTELIRKSGN